MQRKHKKRPEDIKDILSKLITKIQRRGPGTKEKISNAWQRAAGEKAEPHSRPVTIKRKILTVEVDSSTWIYALNLKKKNILDYLKKELGEDKIKDVRFRMGDIT